MEAYAKSISKILHSSDQFLVPFFQRYYKWGRKDWERLRSDLWSLMQDDRGRKHFLGPLVCTAQGASPGDITTFQLIDGQQRLTTLSLLLCALRDVALQSDADELAARIEEHYLIHKYEKKLRRYKLLPRTGDREVFAAIVDQKGFEEHADQQVAQAYDFFRKHIRQLAQTGGEEGLQRLFQQITGGLYLVVITIDEENPYEIFESLNSTGLPLAESDLIRNFLFMHVAQDEQEDFQEDHWEPYESLFDATEGHDAIPQTPFYRSFLMRDGVYSQAKATFLDFKEYHRQNGKSPVEQVAELQRYASFERQLRRPGTVSNPAISKRLRSVASMEISTSHPLLLNLLDRHERGDLASEELLGCLDDLCSFVLRRSLCGESTRAYGKWFCESITAIKKDPRADLRSYWLHRGWPDDESFHKSLVEFPVYRRDPKKCRLILEELERERGHKERVDLTTLSIEHVLPQTLSGRHAKSWRESLGATWKADHDHWLHTLGNLTLSGYNADMSNRSFDRKQEELARSNVGLNDYFKPLETWDSEAIEARGNELAKKVAALWPRPDGGPVYTPPTQKKKLKAGAERRTAYWGQLLDRLVKDHGWTSLPDPTGGTRQPLPLGTDAGKLESWFKVGQQRLAAVLHLPRQGSRAMYAALQAERATIERELGFPLEWNDYRRTLSAVRGNVSIKDPLDWSEQHTWLAGCLTRLRDVLVPRLEQLRSLNSEADAEAPTRERWTEQAGEDFLRGCDEITDLMNEISDNSFELVYRRKGISLKPSESFFNVMTFYPRKDGVWAAAAPADIPYWKSKLEAKGLRLSSKRKGRLGVLLSLPDIHNHSEILTEYCADIAAGRQGKSTRGEELVEFWELLCENFRERGASLTPQSPRPQAWMNFAIGRSDAWLLASLNSIEKRCSVGLGIRGENRQSLFEALERERQAIEREIGSSLEWLGDSNRKSQRIYTRLRDVDVRDSKAWPEIYDWMHEQLQRFQKALVSRLSAMD